jgi:hypothetical protein
VSDIATVAADSLKVLDPKRPIREEKREPVSDIATVAADSLKVLDPKRPIREAADSLKVLDPKRPIREADMTGNAAGSTGSRMTQRGQITVSDLPPQWYACRWGWGAQADNGRPGPHTT